jgi:hypothetical protein
VIKLVKRAERAEKYAETCVDVALASARKVRRTVLTAFGNLVVSRQRISGHRL